MQIFRAETRAASGIPDAARNKNMEQVTGVGPAKISLGS